MNALDLIKKTDPDLYSKFLKAFSQDIGLDAGSFRCPHCDQPLQVTAVARQQRTAGSRQVAAEPKPRQAKRVFRKPAPGSLFQLLVDLARLRNTTTGTINREFSKTFKSRKRLSPKELKAAKVIWTKQQIAKAKQAA
jgi:hypothetical protein